MITGAKHEGYISVWARVRSTRVPNIIHHEGKGGNAYKDKRDIIDPLRYYDIFEILSLPVQNYNFLSLALTSVERSRPGVIICGDKMRYRIKMLSEK